MNESLLKELLHFVEQFSSQHPQEAQHVFEEPLQWRTALLASDFPADFDIRSVPSQIGSFQLNVSHTSSVL